MPFFFSNTKSLNRGMKPTWFLAWASQISTSMGVGLQHRGPV